MSQSSYLETFCMGAPVIGVVAVILLVILKELYNLIRRSFFDNLRGAKPYAIIFHGNDGKESTVTVESDMTVDIPSGVAWRRGGGRGYVSVGKGLEVTQTSSSGSFPAQDAIKAAEDDVKKAESGVNSATDDVGRRAAQVVVDRHKRKLKKARAKITVRGPSWMFIEEGADSVSIKRVSDVASAVPSSSSQDDEVYVYGVEDNAKLESAWDDQGRGGPVLGGITSGRMEQRYDDAGTDIWAADDWSQYDPQFTIDRPKNGAEKTRVSSDGAYNTLATFGDSAGGLSKDAGGAVSDRDEATSWYCTIS